MAATHLVGHANVEAAIERIHAAARVSGVMAIRLPGKGEAF